VVKKNKSIVLLLFFVFVGLMFLSGCQETSTENENDENTEDEVIMPTYSIASNQDNGNMAVLTDLIENAFGGIVPGSDQPILVGITESGGGDNLTYRGIFRFNISGWEDNKTSLTFHAKCVYNLGAPGDVEIYLTNDTGPLNQTEMIPLMDKWNLTSQGIKLRTVTPIMNEWIVAGLAVDDIDRMVTNERYITIIVKLVNESLGSNEDVWGFASFGYTSSDDSDVPYLRYKIWT
jgi:hypothetical protein